MLLSPFSNMGFLIFCTGLLYTMNKNEGIVDFFWYQVYRAILFGIQGCDEVTQILNVLLSKFFYVKYNFQGS